MKFLIYIQLICWLNFSFGFLQYPFLAKSLLDSYVTTLKNDQDEMESYSLEQMVSGDKCDRVCKPNDMKICRFHFMLKYFQTMGG